MSEEEQAQDIDQIIAASREEARKAGKNESQHSARIVVGDVGTPETGPFYTDAGATLRLVLDHCYEGDCTPEPPAGTTFYFGETSVYSPFYHYIISLDDGSYLACPKTVEGSNPISFASNSPGQNAILGVYPGMFPASDVYNVRIPASLVDHPIVTQPSIYPKGQSYWLVCGSKKLDGFSVTYDFAPVTGLGGRLGVIQLINSVRKITENNDKVVTNSTGGYVLDKTATQVTAIYRDHQVDVTAQTLLMTDSPAQELSNAIKEVDIVESFTNYLMFKSNSAGGSFWVPLLTMSWAWKAHATRTGIDQWELSGDETAIVSYPVATMAFPVWTKHIGSINPHYHAYENATAPEARRK